MAASWFLLIVKSKRRPGMHLMFPSQILSSGMHKPIPGAKFALAGVSLELRYASL